MIPKNDADWQDYLRDADDRLITLHGPIIKRLKVFGALVICAIAILGGTMITALGIFKEQRQDACQTRNAQIVAQNRDQDRSRAFLRDVADGMRRDGLKHTPTALDRYIAQIESQDRLEPIQC